MLLKALGLTPEQVAKRELEDYDVDKGGRDVTFGDQVGDSIMSLLTGKDYAKEVAEKTRQEYVKQIKRNNNAEARLNRTKDVVGYDNLTDGQLESMTATQLNNALQDRERTKAARSLAAAKTGIGRDQFLTTTDPGEIEALAAQYVKEEADKKTEKANTKEENRYDERMRLLYQDRADARAAQNRNYQLQIMQLQQADKLKAQERKDRMFMTLMAGLQNLGQGFTI